MKRQDSMDLIHILLAEDEPQLAQILHDTLADEGFRVTSARDGVEALELYGQKQPDVLVVDVMMPRMDGFELVRRIRRVDQQTPVLFLTARSATEDVVAGFELGADDYLKKPFGMRELIVRVQNLVRRRIVQGGSTSEGSPHVPDVGQNDFFNKSHGWEGQGRREENLPPPESSMPRGGDESGVYAFGNFLLDATQQRLTHVLTGAVTDLSHREAEILRALCQHRGEVVESRGLLLALWGDDSIWNARSLHVFITKLRHHLHQDPSLRIVNVRGVGYKLLD